MGFLALIHPRQLPETQGRSLVGTLALLLGLSACSPQILGERLSESCDLKGFTYSNTSITAIKLRETLTSVPQFNEGVPLGFEVEPALPAGVNLDPSTGVISGVATSVSPNRTYTVRATSPSNCSVTRTLDLRITGTDPVRSNLGVNKTQTSVGTSPDTTVTLTLLDSNGEPMVGNQVALTSNRPQDVIAATSGAVTDSNGRATFTLHSTLSGTATLTAVDVTDLETLSTTGSLEFTPGTAVRMAAVGLPGTMVAGIDLTIEIQAVDTYGNRDTAFNGVGRVSHNDSSSFSSGAGPASLNLVSGRAEHPLRLTRAGTTTVSVEHLPASGPALTPGTTEVIINPGVLNPSKTLIIAPTPALTAGQDYAFEIEPQDSFGNPGPSNPASASDLSWAPSPSSTGTIVSGNFSWSSIKKRFDVVVTGWTAGTLDLRVSIRATNGQALNLTVNHGPTHHLTLENLPSTITAGDTITDLRLTSFDVAGNRTPHSHLPIQTFLDPNCKIPSPGAPADNTNSPHLTYDPDAQSGTYAPLQIFNSKTRRIGISATTPFCSGEIIVNPGPVSTSESYLTFDHFPFLPNLESRVRDYPTSKMAPIRGLVFDAYKNPVPDYTVLIRRTDFNRASSFSTLERTSGSWEDQVPEVEEMVLTSDSDGVIRFQVRSGGIPDRVTLSAITDQVNWTLGAEVDFDNGVNPDNLNTGNITGNGLVLQDPEVPQPIVEPVDTPAPPQKNPNWIVAVQINNGHPDPRIICPGVLMTMSLVLTPASCLIHRAFEVEGTLEVQAGSYWDSSFPSNYRQTRTVQGVRLDPTYTPELPLSDLAIIQVSSAFTPNTFIQPAHFKSGSVLTSKLTTYSWHTTINYLAYATPFNTRPSSFLISNDESDPRSTYTFAGIPTGSTTFSMPYFTLGPSGRGRTNSLITAGQYAILAGELNEFLGFTVAGGDFREPQVERLTVDTAIQVESTHPFINDILSTR